MKRNRNKPSLDSGRLIDAGAIFFMRLGLLLHKLHQPDWTLKDEDRLTAVVMRNRKDKK